MADGISEVSGHSAVRQLNAGMSLADFKTIYWWEWAHRLIGRVIGVGFLCALRLVSVVRLDTAAPSRGLWMILASARCRARSGGGWWLRPRRSRRSVQYRLATHLVLACLIYVAWSGPERDGKTSARSRFPGFRQSRPIGDCSRRRHCARDILLAQIYLGALVAGLRAGHAYNTWPLIDGGFVRSPRGCSSKCRCGGIFLKIRSQSSSIIACSAM